MSAFELDRSQWRSFLELLGKDIRKVRLRSFFPKGHPLKERDRGKKSNANGDWIKHCQEEGLFWLKHAHKKPTPSKRVAHSDSIIENAGP